MKNKIAIASAFLAASSFSMGEIVVNDFLSFEGFVDMSYSHTDAEFENDDQSDNSFAIDQVEISWLFDFDAVTAQIDLEYEEAGDETEVEQAFVNYALGNGGVVTAGRYASMLGFEAFEPTGLYQYSTAYDDAPILPGYAQGVKYTRESEDTFFGISIQDEAFGTDANRLGGSGDSSFAVEVAGSIALEDGITVFLGGAYEDADAGDTYVVNGYVTYETGAWLFAAELNVGTQEVAGFDDVDSLSGLVMANYAYSDVASVTGRISYYDVDAGNQGEADFTKFTVAHNYALSDNLLLVTELSLVDGESDTTDFESVVGAVELLFSF
ncbi:porin [Opitutales bacterium]|nr:porin [Opitutales bacterium]